MTSGKAASVISSSIGVEFRAPLHTKPGERDASAVPQALHLKTTEVRTPSAPSLSSQVLLDEMIANTQRLDGILQGMCSSSRRTTQHEKDKATEPSGSDSGYSVRASAESFEALVAWLQASVSKQRSVAVDLDDALLLNDSLTDDDNEGQDADPSWWLEFSQHTVLCLPSRAISSASSFALPPVGHVIKRSPSGATISHVDRRLRQELAACDHLLPASTAKALAHRALQHLESHSTLLERGVSIDEGEHDGSWGLRLALEAQSRLESADKSSETSSGPETNSPQVVAATTRHVVFVSKRDYGLDTTGADGGPMTSACLVELSLVTSEAKAALQPATATEATESLANESIKDGNQQRDGSTPASSASASQPVGPTALTLLPDVLDVFVSGGHAPATNRGSSAEEGADGADGDAAYWSPTSAFSRLDVPSTLPRRNRVVQAACGRLHSLLVNDLGMVFACGYATHGALGISGAASLASSPSDFITAPTLVEFFLEKLVVVTQVACGGDALTGAHSAAVTTDGELFTWGAGVALGSGSLRNAFEPQRVRFPVDSGSEEDNGDSAGGMRIQSVACGCGFAVAIARDGGAAFAWGKWSEGRLGLGRIPVIERTSRRHGGRKQLQAFQLSPRRIMLPIQKSDVIKLAATSKDAKPPTFAKVACGDMHCVAITTGGRLVSWGCGGSGQLGVGTPGDALSPVAVVVTNLPPDASCRWQDVAAGSDWSMALDSEGRVWSWGACGSGSLGLGAASAAASTRRAIVTRALLTRHEELVDRQRRRESETEGTTGRSNRVEATPSNQMPRFVWMAPQLVPAFAAGDMPIVSISAGVRHGAALSQSGDLFVWGDDYDSEKRVETCTPHLVNNGSGESDATPNAMKASTIVESIACGGHQVVALTSSGGSLGRDLRALYQRCMQLSVDSERSERTRKDTSDWGKPDVALLVSGRRLFAHKFLLARRSPVLRRLLLDQLAAFDASSASFFGRSVTEVLVPSLRLDVARVVLEFIYTDAVALPSHLLCMRQEQQRQRLSSAHVAIYLARDVLRAATALELPRLARICRRRLIPALSPAAGSYMALDDGGEGDDEASTLIGSLHAAYGDSTWSDVTLVAEGRAVAAHRCILVARSGFFRRLLGRDLQAASFVVEDSYVGLMRVLDFIYNDRVAVPLSLSSLSPASSANPDKSDENRPATETLAPSPQPQGRDEEELQLVLNDLLAADRYGLERMKRECERFIIVTTGNCWEVLDAAERAHAWQLKLAALGFAQRHLPHVVLGSSDSGDAEKSTASRFERFRRAHPRLVAELFAKLRTAHREDRLMMDWRERVEARVQQEQREEERVWQERRASARFPWLSLTLALTFGALFLALMHSHEYRYHPVVPALNLAALALLAAAAVFGWLERI